MRSKSERMIDQRGIRGHQLQTFNLSLRKKKAIERITHMRISNYLGRHMRG